MRWWKLNAYIWSFSAAGWGWVAYAIDLPEALIVALVSGGLAAVCVSKANAN